jgi:beta-lactam-binding protein with PASTA domain
MHRAFSRRALICGVLTFAFACSPRALTAAFVSHESPSRSAASSAGRIRLASHLGQTSDGPPGGTLPTLRKLPPDARLQAQTRRCVVPSLIGIDARQVEGLLRQYRLAIGQVSKREARDRFGVVVDQSPAPKQVVTCGAPVSVWVAVPPSVCTTRVPKLAEGDISRAWALLKRTQLTVGRVERVESELQVGTVIRQAPAPGESVKCGTAVDLWVAIAQPVCTARVPGLIEGDYERAGSLLERARLTLGRVERVESRLAAGTVLKQAPSPGETVKCGTPVHLAVAIPARACTTQVPNLAEVAADRASALLERTQLTIGRVERVESPEPSGTVLRQTPAPGATVKCGTPVDLSVAEPPRTCTTQVPRLSEAAVERAAALLERTRLALGRVERIESRLPAGTVLKQAPAPGVTVRCGTPVDVAIAVAPRVCMTQVPGLAEAGVERAGALLERTQLTVGRVERIESSSPAGTVLRQAPAPGQSVMCGTPVDLWVAEPPRACLESVPSLERRDLDSARALLERARLTLGRVDQLESTLAAGIVLKQAPAPGQTVACGTRVDVWVARRPAPCTVPSVLGDDPRRAAARLSAVNLALGEIGQRESDRAAGTVVAQIPAPGELAACGSRVNVWIAAPAAPCAVPDLVGSDARSATARLRDARLEPGEIGERESERAAGTVIAQSLRPGESVRCGSRVNLWLARPFPPLRVPLLRGRQRAEATSLLTRTGLQLGSVGDRPSAEPAGTVVDQDPGAGTQVARGARVSVWLAAPPTVSRVPPLGGRDRAAAGDVLRDAGLVLGDVNEREAGEPAGTVVDQAPAPGTDAAPGTPVHVWLAIPALVEVPDVTSQSVEEARRLTAERGLVVGVRTSPTPDRPAGTVLAQQPAPGARVARGTTVDLVVSEVSVPPGRVPNVVGVTLARGIETLREAGLRPGRIDEVVSDAGTGTITWQRPAAARIVAAGAEVDLHVAARPIPPRPVLPWALAGVAAGLAAALAGARARQWLARPTSLVPCADAGTQDVLGAEDVGVEFEISLRAELDGGEQALENAEALVVREPGSAR